MKHIDERYFPREEMRDWHALTSGQQAHLSQEAMEYALIKGKFEFLAEVAPGVDLGRDEGIATFVMEPSKWLANSVLWLAKDFTPDEFDEMLTSEAMLQTYGSLEGVKNTYGVGMYQMLKTDPVKFMTENQKVATEYFKVWAEKLYEDEFIHL